MNGADHLAAALGFLGDALSTDRPLGPLCTYRVGGRARCFVEAGDVATLARIGSALGALAEPPPVLVVGRGSNMLVAEAGFDGVAVHLTEALAEVRVHGHRVLAGGAASLPVVARRTVAESLSGFEWAVGVPGSIGGAVRMNAGGHGADMAASLVGVRLVDLHSGETRSMRGADLGLGYRRSRVAPQEVVVEAELLLGPGDRRQGEELISRIVRWRRDHQPGGQNAGSVFANPRGDSAGRLIEAAGCKGARVGTAAVSTKHANFIQADPGGSADDVFALMVEVARAVRDHSGVSLRPETHLVGFPPFEEAVG